MDVLYVVERDTAAFESARTAVDIVCAGDSLTGWNNFGPSWQWPFRTIGNLGRMVQLLLDRGKQPILFNVPQVNEAVFPPSVVEEIHGKRDHHNPRLKAFCDQHSIPLADICCLLRNEHFGDELHPNDRGAKSSPKQCFQC